VRVLAQSKLSNEENIKLVLEGIKSSFPVEQLSYSDFLYISLLRKISTLGSQKFYVMFTCPHCGQVIKPLMELTDFEFTELEIPSLPLIADMSFGEVKFSLLTVERYLKLLQSKATNDDIAVLSVMTDQPYDQIYAKFKESVGLDARTLDQVDQLLFHGVKERSYKCENKKCERDFSVAIDGGLEVLLVPFRGDSEPPESRIRFSEEPQHSS